MIEFAAFVPDRRAILTRRLGVASAGLVSQLLAAAVPFYRP